MKWDGARYRVRLAHRVVSSRRGSARRTSDSQVQDGPGGRNRGMGAYMAAWWQHEAEADCSSLVRLQGADTCGAGRRMACTAGTAGTEAGGRAQRGACA